MAEKAGNASRGSGRHTKEPRGGTPKGKRASGNSQAARRSRRLNDPRVRTALDEARREREKIAALIAANASTETEGSRRAAMLRVWVRDGDLVADDALAPSSLARPGTRVVVNPESRQVGEKGWTLGQSRILISDGYSLDSVVARTGWGAWWFRDLVALDGYARPVFSELSA